jgi:hypothetical protein
MPDEQLGPGQARPSQTFLEGHLSDRPLTVRVHVQVYVQDARFYSFATDTSQPARPFYARERRLSTKLLTRVSLRILLRHAAGLRRDLQDVIE